MLENTRILYYPPSFKPTCDRGNEWMNVFSVMFQGLGDHVLLFFLKCPLSFESRENEDK